MKISKALLAGVAVCGVLWSLSGTASAHDQIGFSLSFGVPVEVYAPPPVVYYPARPVYAPPPPVYYAPGYYQGAQPGWYDQRAEWQRRREWREREWREHEMREHYAREHRWDDDD